MSIYPKKKPEMLQLADNKVQAKMEGKERIYSRTDTAKIISMANNAKSKKDLVMLGRFVYKATKKQDSTAPEFTE